MRHSLVNAAMDRPKFPPPCEWLCEIRNIAEGSENGTAMPLHCAKGSLDMLLSHCIKYTCLLHGEELGPTPDPVDAGKHGPIISASIPIPLNFTVKTNICECESTQAHASCAEDQKIQRQKKTAARIPKMPHSHPGHGEATRRTSKPHASILARPYCSDHSL